ncbi:MAG TPA: hypothetical protein VHV51_11405 [Polyangiaceae bacterium]|jgi:hypothetical protein|nr:hypothetical protein [Polyangiaceae bacterium]
MPTRDEMLELVQAHAGLEDRMDAAIWIRRDAPDAWLVEVLPDLPADRHPGRPVHFNAGRTFRHELNLIAANAEDLRAAIRADVQLAAVLADGEVLHGGDAAHEFVTLAEQARDGHAQAG